MLIIILLLIHPGRLITFKWLSIYQDELGQAQIWNVITTAIYVN